MLFGTNPHYLYGAGTYLERPTSPFLCRAARHAGIIGVYEVHDNGRHGTFVSTTYAGITSGEWLYAPGANDELHQYPSFGIRVSVMAVGRNEQRLTELEKRVVRNEEAQAIEIATLRRQIEALTKQLQP